MEYILERLLRTETSAMISIADQKIFTELGVKNYQFIHIDGCKCKLCSDIDGRVFILSEYFVGLTAPPLHPNCNDRAVPVVNEE